MKFTILASLLGLTIVTRSILPAFSQDFNAQLDLAVCNQNWQQAMQILDRVREMQPEGWSPDLQTYYERLKDLHGGNVHMEDWSQNCEASATTPANLPSSPAIASGFPAGARIVKTANMDESLYPGRDLPYRTKIDLEGSQNVVGVGILTDWWQKRPTRIQVYEVQNGRRGKLLGRGEFPEYLDRICGRQFNRKCEYPDRDGSARAELKIPFTAIATVEEIEVELDGLLSEPNEFVILFGVRVYGASQ
ncbi:MAG: hypothetical protein J7647_28880 [Cyanobacteria bacterium SBLK]|nr:hypothetical protein [Cyanobacteria bacterium SBLK]